jgi:hypothetical protein
MRVQRITNPIWLGAIAPNIQAFTKKLDMPTMDYETLYVYFVNSIQVGALSEFWVAVDDDNKPCAFAHWLVRGLPFRGVVLMDFVYNWGSKDAIPALIDEFIKFGQTKRAMYYEGHCINERVLRLFNRYANQYQMDFKPSDERFFLARKR